MPARTGTAHVVTTTRTYKDQVYRTHLLRRSYREDGKVKNETLGNLSHLPEALIEIIRRSLQGETFVPLGQAFEIIALARARPRAGGAAAMQRLELSHRCSPASPRANANWCWRWWPRASSRRTPSWPPRAGGTPRRWQRTSAWPTRRGRSVRGDGLAARAPGRDPEEAGGAPPERRRPGAVRPVVELLRRHHCPLAKLGYNRDGKKGLLQVNYGLLTDARGCPVAVSVYEGNVADSTTLLPEVKRLREHFGIEQLVMVGDRGMISNKAIAELQQTPAWTGSRR